MQVCRVRGRAKEEATCSSYNQGGKIIGGRKDPE